MSVTSRQELDAVASYAEELEDLTWNSKPIINSLTMIAEELLPYCASVVSVIEKKISAASSEKKLPVLYLLDSICKNVGGDYIRQFSRNLPMVMSTAYNASEPKVQAALQGLVKTWEGVFPRTTIQQVSDLMGTTQPKQHAPPRTQPAPAHAAARAPAVWVPQQPVAFTSPDVSVAPLRPVSGGVSCIDPRRLGVDSSTAGRKRLRQQEETGRGASMRLELESLMGKVRAQLHSSVPFDSRGHAALDRAVFLCRGLLAQSPLGSGEHAMLNAQLGDLLRLQQEQQAHSMASAYAVAPRPPPPPPLSSAKAPATRVDASDLFAQLAAAGIVRPVPPASTAMAPPLPPPQPPTMQLHAPHEPLSAAPIPQPPHASWESSAAALVPEALHRLYFGRALQCKECAQRFDTGQQDELRRHMDWHLKRSKRDSAKGAVPSSRRWLLPTEKWVLQPPGGGDVEDEPLPSAFDAKEAVVDAVQSTAVPATAEAAADRVPVVRAPADVTRVICSQCGEEIKLFWDTESEEWMLRDAVPSGDGKYAHSKCAS